MQLSDLIADVRSRIQEPQASTWTDAEITGWLNRALDDLSEVACYEAPPYAISTVANQGIYPLPSDCLRDGLRRVTWTMPQGSTSGAVIPLRYVDRDEYDRLTMYGGQGTWGPVSYAPMYTIWNNQLYLLPQPTQNGNNDLTLYYYAYLPYLVNSTDVPVIPRNRHEALVLYAVARCQEMIEESNLFVEFMQQYETQKQLLADEVTRNQRDMPRMVRQVWY